MSLVDDVSRIPGQTFKTVPWPEMPDIASFAAEDAK
jgi:hypothetical protein